MIFFMHILGCVLCSCQDAQFVICKRNGRGGGESEGAEGGREGGEEGKGTREEASKVMMRGMHLRASDQDLFFPWV